MGDYTPYRKFVIVDGRLFGPGRLIWHPREENYSHIGLVTADALQNLYDGVFGWVRINGPRARVYTDPPHESDPSIRMNVEPLLSAWADSAGLELDWKGEPVDARWLIGR